MAEPTPPPSPRKTQAGVREVGYAAVPSDGAAWWTVELNEEQTPELRWPDNLAIYDAMRKQDAQVSSVLRAVTHPVRRTPKRIDPNGARPEVVQLVADDLGLPIMGENEKDRPRRRTRDRFSWAEHERHALLMLPFGHMAFEQVYRIDPDTGLARLRKLGPRMPRSIAKFNVARDGGLLSIEQHPIGGEAQGITIPISRLVMYVNEREAGNWAGVSLLRPAYKNWLLKDRLLRTHAMATDRNGMGIPVYEGAENETDLTKGEEIATATRAGDNSGAAVPYGAKLRLVGIEGQIPDALPGVKYHDEQIARAVLAHFLNLGSQTGSWALGSTLGDFFTQSLQAVADEVADVTTQHVIEDLVDINFGPEEPAPRLVYDEIGSQTAALALAIKTLVDAGVISPDEQLEAHIRLGLGLPASEPDKPRPPNPEESS